MRAAWVVALLAITGCAAPLEAPPESDPMAGYACVADPMPVHDGHDHGDAALHRFACNAALRDMETLAGWGFEDGQNAGAHAATLNGDLLAVAVNGAQNGFHLFRVGGDAALVHLAFHDAGMPVGGDRTIAFAPDGTTVFLGYATSARPGVAAVDVTDPTAPREVGFWQDPTGGGPHTVAAGEIGGVTHVFSLAFGVEILSYESGTFQHVARYVAQEELAIADVVQRINSSSSDPTGSALTYALRTVYGHDMTFYDDTAASGRALLLVAYAYDGAKMLDVSNPLAPTLLASWMPPQDTSHKHYTHSVTAERLEDGTLVVVVGSETFEPENRHIASPVWILDGTAAAAAMPTRGALVHEGTWRNPGGAPAGNLGLSVHFHRQLDGFVYVSHYHGGVWAVDARTPEARAEPTAFGYLLPIPHEPVATPEPGPGFMLHGAPTVMDVEVGADHTVYGVDIHQGVSAIAFGPVGA